MDHNLDCSLFATGLRDIGHACNLHRLWYVYALKLELCIHPFTQCLCQQISISHAAGDVDDLGTECHCQNPQLPLACSDIYARQSRNLGSRMDVGELYGNCTKWMVVSSESIELNYHRIQMDDAQETSHLLKTEIIGQWKVHSCITCCCITHATNESSTAVITNLVNAKRKKQFYQLA